MSNIPTFGVGTFRLNGQVVIDSVRTDGQVVASIDHARYLVFAAGFVLFFFACHSSS